VQRSAEAPVSLGFSKSIKVQVVTQSSGSVSDDNYHLEFPVEGSRSKVLGWGSAGAKDITIQFQFDSTINGLYTYTIMEGRNLMSYRATFNYTGSGANQTITATIPGATSGSWQTDKAVFGLKALIDLGTGSGYEGAAGSWTANGKWRVPGTVRFIDHPGAIMHVTGLQSDIGGTALPFRFLTDDEYLKECQQFIYKTYPVDVPVKSLIARGSIGYVVQNSGLIPNGVVVRYPVEMSSQPFIMGFNPVSGTNNWLNRTGAPKESAAVLYTDYSEAGVFVTNAQVVGDIIGDNIITQLLVVSQMGTDWTALQYQINQ